MPVPPQTTQAHDALRNLLAEPLAVVMVPGLRTLLPDMRTLAEWSPIAAVCSLLIRQPTDAPSIDDRSVRELANLSLPADFQAALAARLHPDNLTAWIAASPGTPVPLLALDEAASSQIGALILQKSSVASARADRIATTWSGPQLLAWLWWSAQSPDLSANLLPTQAQDGALAPLLLYRTVIALGTMRSPDRRTEQLTRYLGTRARYEDDRALLMRWADCIGTARVPDDAFGAALVHRLQLQQWQDVSETLQQCASQSREPLLRMSWLVAAILIGSRHRPVAIDRQLDLIADCWRAAGDAGTTGAAVRDWTMHLVDASAARNPQLACATASSLLPGSLTALLCQAYAEPRAALSIARSLGQLVVAHDDTPAMVDAWADIDTLQSWSMAFAADDAVLMNELGASLEPRWRTLVQAVAAECSQPKADQLPDDVRVLIETGQWTAPRLRTVALTPEAGLLNAYWQGVRLNPRGALAFIAPLLSQHSSPPSPPADLTVSVYRTWLEEWLLTPDAGVAACAPVQTWVFAAARILGSEATWQIARAMALHRAERLVPLLCALAIAPDDELDNTLWAAVDVIDAQPLRVRMLDLILSRWSPDATPVPDPRLVSAAAEVLESEPRHRAALHISGLAAEAGRQWETAVGLWERLARLTNDPGNRAQIYLRMATLLDERLQNSNAALENVIVSFICAPWEPASLAILEMRYRAQRRFRDLASSYTAAAESLVARGNRQQASELLARRAQIELQGIDSPEAAAASLVEAVRLNPSALNLVMLLEQHVAPRAGMHWVERAREAVRSAGPASS